MLGARSLDKYIYRMDKAGGSCWEKTLAANGALFVSTRMRQVLTPLRMGHWLCCTSSLVTLPTYAGSALRQARGGTSAISDLQLHPSAVRSGGTAWGSQRVEGLGLRATRFWGCSKQWMKTVLRSGAMYTCSVCRKFSNKPSLQLVLDAFEACTRRKRMQLWRSWRCMQ